MYVSVILCSVAASKCHHHCGVNLQYCHHYMCYHFQCAQTLCVYICLLLYICDCAASKCQHCCGVNVTVTVAVLHKQHLHSLQRECDGTGSLLRQSVIATCMYICFGGKELHRGKHSSKILLPRHQTIYHNQWSAPLAITFQNFGGLRT